LKGQSDGQIAEKSAIAESVSSFTPCQLAAKQGVGSWSPACYLDGLKNSMYRSTGVAGGDTASLLEFEMNMTTELAGKTALVTGASRGIGRATARGEGAGALQ